MTTVWRNFKFFDAELLKSSLCHIEIISCCYGPKLIFAGSGEGTVYAIDRSGSGGDGLSFEFQAYKGPVTHMKHMRSRNMLITLGDDDALNVCVFRIWTLDAAMGRGAAEPVASSAGRVLQPPCKEYRIFSARQPPPPNSVILRTNYNTEVINSLNFKGPKGGTSSLIPLSSFRTVVVALDVAEDLQCAAVALVSNEIVLLSGDLETHGTVRIRRLRSRFASGPVAFVGFTPALFFASDEECVRQSVKNGEGHSHKGGAAMAHAMYTAFADVVTVWRVASSLDCKEYCCEPQFGASPGCCCMTDSGQLVATSVMGEGIALFGCETIASTQHRTAQRQFEEMLISAVHFVEMRGPKRAVLAYRSYVFVLTQSESRPEKFSVQCYDLINGLRCLSRSQENSFANIAWVIADASDILVISHEPPRFVDNTNAAVGDAGGGNVVRGSTRCAVFTSHRLVRLVEIGLQRRLQQLFHKECYDIAEHIARRAHANTASAKEQHQHLMDVKKRYGDYLMGKHDYTGAVQQYVGAIGYVEPSYVIRVLVEAEQTVHLTRYLEELHHTRHGRIAHTSHTTLLLCCYIQLRDAVKLESFIRRDDIHLDVRTTIDVCLRAGYHEAALYLADKYALSHDHVVLLLDYMHSPQKALEFIHTLSVDDAETIFQRQGRQIIQSLPRKATEMLIELCVHWGGPVRRLATDTNVLKTSGGPWQQHRSDAKLFTHLFADMPICLMNFLRGVVDSGVLDDDEKEPHGGGGQNAVLYNALLELYMTRELDHGHRTDADAEIGAFPAESFEERLGQALIFLKRHSGRYDDSHALVLTHLYNFEEGALLLLRRLHHSTQLMQYYSKGLEEGASALARAEAKRRLTELCMGTSGDTGSRGGDEEKGEDGVKTLGMSRELWLSVLSVLARNSQVGDCDLQRVLECVAARDALSPLSVLPALSRSNPKLPLAMFREYLLDVMSKEARQAEVIARDTEQRLKELKKLHSKLDRIQTRATVFQETSCTQCGMPLDVPVIYFLCQHAFHQRCLGSMSECNICRADNERRAVAEQQRSCSVDAGKFFQSLDGASYEDAFETVAEQFGKCIFGNPSLHAEAPGHDNELTSSRNRLATEWEEIYDEDGDLLRPEAVELW
ncbi:hypothetical protein TRVL_05307 [Trypanosoma vivax]|nr:hypothetical protein TRVL_05307 [Trypanosoma vivax]